MVPGADAWRDVSHPAIGILGTLEWLSIAKHICRARHAVPY